MSLPALSDVSAGAIVAARTMVASIKFLTENSSVAVVTLAEESTLWVSITDRSHMLNDDRKTKRTVRTVLVTLDLSAEFPSTDHNVLLHRLRHIIGINGTALGWFRTS